MKRKILRAISLIAVFGAVLAANGFAMTMLFSQETAAQALEPFDAQPISLSPAEEPSQEDTLSPSLNAVSEETAIEIAAAGLAKFDRDVSGMDAFGQYLRFGSYWPGVTDYWRINFYYASKPFGTEAYYLYEAMVDAFSGELLSINQCYGMVDPVGPRRCELGTEDYNLETGEITLFPRDENEEAYAVIDRYATGEYVLFLPDRRTQMSAEDKAEVLETAKAACEQYGIDIDGMDTEVLGLYNSWTVIFFDASIPGDVEQEFYAVDSRALALGRNVSLNAETYDDGILRVYKAVGTLDASIGDYEFEPVLFYR